MEKYSGSIALTTRPVCFGVFGREFRSAQPQQPDDRGPYSGPLELLHGLHHLCRRDPLVDAAEDLVAAAFQAQVDDVQFPLPKGGKLGVGLAQDVAGVGVDAYAP